jgi:amino acid adenylation domain-containing protein
VNKSKQILPRTRKRLLRQPGQGYPEFRIHELFEQQARRTPDRTALICSGEAITFAELNRRANRIARALRARGVGLETLVGFCLERSIEAVSTLIGILKAGAAYVYLDPNYPRRRLQAIAQDAGLSLILTKAELRRRLFPHSPEVEMMDPDSKEVRRQKPGNLGIRVSLENAAYVIFTSGSTGRPKGAVEVHGSMTSRLISAPLPDIQPRDVCCLNSSFSFGVTATRLFFPLVQGARVVLLGDNDVKDVTRFAHSLDQHQVTSVFMPPALLKSVLLLQEQGSCGLDSLRAVTVTGSTLTPELIRRFRRALPKALLINVYGSTEVGTTATMTIHGGRRRTRPGSLGRPVANTRVYVLDPQLRPVRPGEMGEICVASRHLAREYLNQPELTAERFLPVPLGKPGDRMYRTGDLGRLLPNGEIQFHGRTDHQVKVRGYRIELGEIEAAVLGHDSVQEAVVTAPGTGDERRLVAYVVGRRGAAPDMEGIKQLLAENLPAYMLPSAYVIMRELPLTDAGKVNRQALPEPGSFEAASPDESPKTDAEQRIARLFSELLKTNRVSVQDNFIQLGGDSLGVTQLLVAIRSEFQRDVPARLVFDGTLGEIATKVTETARVARQQTS